MRIRSGFKKGRKKNRASKALWAQIKKSAHAVFSLNIFQLKPFRKVGQSRQRGKAKSYLRRDIHQRSYENPYHQSKGRKYQLLYAIAQKRYIIAHIALVISLLSLFIVIFARPTFYLSRIDIQGSKEIQDDDLKSIISDYLEKRSWLFIKHSHLLFLNKSKLEETIRSYYGLESITFNTHWPSKLLSVSLEEKISVLTYSVQDEYFTIDRQGTIIRKLSDESIKDDNSSPIIYQFDLENKPNVGEQVLTASNISTILELFTAFNKYNGIQVHSFRLKTINKDKIVIPEKFPKTIKENQAESEDANESLDELAQSIAQAKTLEEKIATIKETLNDIDIEKIEEGGIENYLETEKQYYPDDSIIFQELEVYTTAGWTIKLGNEILREPESIQKYLNIFATLSREGVLEGEVKEYVDLRFPNRIYYR